METLKEKKRNNKTPDGEQQSFDVGVLFENLEEKEEVEEKFERRWHHPDNGNFVDDEFIVEWVNKSKTDTDNEYRLIIGTDSHMAGMKFRFITALVLYKVGKGGMYYLLKNYEPREMFRGNQRGRMYHEASMSIELATWVYEKTGLKPEIHLDVSPKKAGKFTSGFSDSLRGYVISSGFEAKIKHESWTASAIADKHTKTRGRRNKKRKYNRQKTV